MPGDFEGPGYGTNSILGRDTQCRPKDPRGLGIYRRENQRLQRQGYLGQSVGKGARFQVGLIRARFSSPLPKFFKVRALFAGTAKVMHWQFRGSRSREVSRLRFV